LNKNIAQDASVSLSKGTVDTEMENKGGSVTLVSVLSWQAMLDAKNLESKYGSNDGLLKVTLYVNYLCKAIIAGISFIA